MVVRREICYFAENTAVKGVGRVLKSQHQCLRVMWILAVIVGTVVAIYQVS